MTLIWNTVRPHVQMNIAMDKKLTIEKKLHVLKRLNEPQVTQRSIAKELGISRKTVQNIVSQKDKLHDFSRSGQSQRRCHVKPAAKFERLNEAMYEWFKRMRDKHGNVPLNENVICNKAVHIAHVLGIQNFKASRGWYRCWRNKYGLASFKVSIN